MKTFNYLFGVLLAERILTPTDNLSKSLQRTDKGRLENVYVVPIRSFDNKIGENAFRKLFQESIKCRILRTFGGFTH